MKKNIMKKTMKKTFIAAAIILALQPASSQCFSWSALFAGCSAKVAALAVTAKEKPVKTALVCTGAAVATVAVYYACRWFFSGKPGLDETKVKEEKTAPDSELNNVIKNLKKVAKKEEKEPKEKNIPGGVDLGITKETLKNVNLNKVEITNKTIPGINEDVPFSPNTLKKTGNKELLKK